MTRLRNRIRKADYFTDGELLRWHRDKRTTYTGLWAIAEDSGCLEDDPFTWKLLIWASPLDADITVELLAQWRDEMVAAGKLIPYEADGKAFLYIRTFHQHEHPRNPQRPDLPLPPWIKCEFKEGQSADGRTWRRTQYTDTNHHDEPQYRLCTDSVVSYPQGEKRNNGGKSADRRPVDNSSDSGKSVPRKGRKVCTDSVLAPPPRPEYLKVHRDRGRRGAKAPAPPAPAEKAHYCPNDGSTIQHDGHCTVCDYREASP